MEGGRQKTSVEQEAEDYVNSVMSSNLVSTRTPLQSGRKRSLSASAADTEVKKRKADSDTDNQTRPIAKARRSILTDEQNSDVIASTSGVSPNTNRNGKGKQPLKSKRRVKGGKENEASATNIDHECDNDIMKILRKLSDDMQSMHQALNKKIDFIEARIESSEKRITDKVTDKVTKIIDKRVNTEASKLRKEIDEKIENLRDDFNIELNEISNRLTSRGSETTDNVEDRYLRVVVRNLPESVNEVPKEKVNTLIKDGLKIREVTVEAAERKNSKFASKPGVIIAKFKNMDDKRKVMIAKKNLKNSRQYDNVFINHDQSREERNMATNMRTLLNGVKRGHTMHLRGSRIVTSDNSDDRDDRRAGQDSARQARDNMRTGGRNNRWRDRRDQDRNRSDGHRFDNSSERQYAQRYRDTSSRTLFHNENRVGDHRNGNNQTTRRD